MPDITISDHEYKELLRDQKKLLALEGGGVDNWEGYSIPLEESGWFDDENL